MRNKVNPSLRFNLELRETNQGDGVVNCGNLRRIGKTQTLLDMACEEKIKDRSMGIAYVAPHKSLTVAVKGIMGLGDLVIDTWTHYKAFTKDIVNKDIKLVLVDELTRDQVEIVKVTLPDSRVIGFFSRNDV